MEFYVNYGKRSADYAIIAHYDNFLACFHRVYMYEYKCTCLFTLLDNSHVAGIKAKIHCTSFPIASL